MSQSSLLSYLGFNAAPPEYASAVVFKETGSADYTKETEDQEKFSDFIPLTVSLMHLEPEDRPVFLPGILYALGRIGEAAAGRIEDGIDGIETALSDPGSQTRAMAVWCLGRIGRHDILLRHSELQQDNGAAQIYLEERLLDITVGELYKKTLHVER